MKILIALYLLRRFYGGVQTWSLTMHTALTGLGHEVSFSTQTPRTKHKGAFDLILCSSRPALWGIKKIKGKKVFISHGVWPRFEQPIVGADIYIAVSEEVAKNCKAKGFPVRKVIRNPIDLDKFYFSGCGEKLKTIAFFDYRRDFKIANKLKSMGFRVIEIGHPPISDPREALALADLVVGRGRSAYEAMAMGKNVIVCGNNRKKPEIEFMDGFVNDETFLKFRHNNLSGRYNQTTISTIDIFLKELEKYNQKQGVSNRNLIFTHNNSENIAKEFLGLVN